VKITVPKISDQLSDKLAVLAQDPSVLTERIYASLMKMEGYEALAPSVRDDIFRSIITAVDLWFDLLLAGTSTAFDIPARIEDAVRRRVHQRVPLQSLLRACQLGSGEIWQATIELVRTDTQLANELLFDISRYLFDYFDAMAQIIIKAYVIEEYQQSRWRDAILHQLYTVVFHAPNDDEGFSNALSALGLDSTLPRVALAIDAGLESLPPDLRASESNRLVLSVSHHFRVQAEMLLHVWHQGKIVVWVPCMRGITISQSDITARECAQCIAGSEAQIRGIGIGLMNQGAAGWATSATEAIRALELAPHGQCATKVRRYASIALEESVRSTANVLRYLVSLIEQLNNEPDLLTTLTTFLAEGRRRKSTADALSIHPNTLTYRLERIENLLGASLDDAEWIAKLDIALRLRG